MSKAVADQRREPSFRGTVEHGVHESGLADPRVPADEEHLRRTRRSDVQGPFGVGQLAIPPEELA